MTGTPYRNSRMRSFEHSRDSLEGFGNSVEISSSRTSLFQPLENAGGTPEAV